MSFIRNTAIVTVVTIIVNILGYAFHILAGRGLGPAAYSEITTMIAYSMIFAVPATVATVLIIKRVGKKGTIKEKFRLIQGFERSLLALIARPLPLIITYFLISTLGYFTGLSPVAYITLPLFILVFIIAQLYVAFLTAGKLFTTFALATLTMAIIKLLGALTAPIFHLIPPVIAFLILASLIQLLYSILILRRHYERNDSSSHDISLLLKDPSLRLILASILGIMLLNNADVVLAKRLLTDSDAGLYGVWSLFAKAITYTFLPFSQVALVYFADRAKGRVGERKILRLSLLILITVGAIAWLGFRLLGSILITTLMGPEFESVIALLPRAALFGTFYSLLYLVNNSFLAKSSRLAFAPAYYAPLVLLILSLFARNIDDFTLLTTILTLPLLLFYLVSSFRDNT